MSYPFKGKFPAKKMNSAYTTCNEQCKKFEVDQLVVFEHKICMVKAIIPTHLGFSTYTVVNIDSGEEYSVGKHRLCAFDFLEMDEAEFSSLQVLLGKLNQTASTSNSEPPIEPSRSAPTSTVVVTAGPSASTSTSTGVLNANTSTSARKRHVEMSQEEIDDIAKRRLCENTDKQTRWAITLLRGTYMYKKIEKKIMFLCLK